MLWSCAGQARDGAIGQGIVGAFFGRLGRRALREKQPADQADEPV
jgi:hypothetical protein